MVTDHIIDMFFFHAVADCDYMMMIVTLLGNLAKLWWRPQMTLKRAPNIRIG